MTDRPNEYTPITRVETIDLEAEASAEDAERVRAEVQAFIQGKGATFFAFMTTMRKDGRPHTRPVATFVEGWTVGTISQDLHLKNQHVRNNPVVGYLWVEQCPPEGIRPKNVWMQGLCEVIDDQAVISDFYQRRQAATGHGDSHADEEWGRLLLRTTPQIVRAEGFLGRLKPALYRQFE
ncbi:MAG: pyridoxamine 5'-phosphate oxidase family protein [Dehalococcoidia bacterium]